jgi:RND family efflux transporter MFP subunit
MLENNTVEKIVNLDEFGDKPFIKRKSTIWGAVIVVILLILVGSAIAKNGNQEEVVDEPVAKQVETITVGDNTLNNFVSSVGVVKPETQVDVVALVRGTVQALFLHEGDQVLPYTTVGELFNSTTLTSYNNALASFNNSQVNYNSTDAVTMQTVKQSELGVQSANLAYQSALNSFENSTDLQNKGNDDLRSNALISFGGYMNTAFSSLDQVNYLVKVEGDRQMAGLENVLGAKKLQSVNDAHSAYWVAKVKYNQLLETGATINDIQDSTRNVVDLYSSIKDLVDKTIVVLENTPTHVGFTEDQLNAQKTIFLTLRTQVVTTYNQSQTTLSNLENIKYYDTQSNNSLQSAVDSAEKQLEIAETSFENAKQGRELQLNSAKSALDGAQGQLQLAQAQLGYLTLHSPIRGTVTEVPVELGQEVNPGQKIATIANTNMVKVELDLPVSDASRIKIGQTAFIDGDLSGVVSRVYPAADSITKKVRVEVVFDNNNQELITETYVDVDIVAETEPDLTQTSFYVPLKSVTIGQSERYVFIVDEDGKAQKLPVIIGEIVEDKIEITEGLRLNDKLIVNGNKWLQGGESLEIKD